MGNKFAIRRNPIALRAARKRRYKELNDFFWKHVGQERYEVESQRALAKAVHYHYIVDTKEKEKRVNVRPVLTEIFSGLQEILERPMFASFTEIFRQ
jgi:hypothetical protein